MPAKKMQLDIKSLERLKDCSLIYCEWLYKVHFGSAGCSRALCTRYRVVPAARYRQYSRYLLRLVFYSGMSRFFCTGIVT